MPTWTGSPMSDTWEYDGNDWTQVTTTHSPGPRFRPAACFDSVRNEGLIFGGINTGPYPYAAETWGFDGVDWTLRLAAGGVPKGSSKELMAFDTRRGVAVLMGASDENIGRALSQVWEWDGAAWVLAVNQSPISAIPLSSPGIAFDSDRGETVLFGTLASGGDFQLDDVWRWNGQGWLRDPSTPGSPTMIIQQGMAYDSDHRELVLFGGISGIPSTMNADTFALPRHDAPAIVRQPAIEAASSSSAAVTMAAVVIGAGPLTYQWRRDGVPLNEGGRYSGTQTTALTLRDATITDDNAYTLTAMNECGSVELILTRKNRD